MENDLRLIAKRVVKDALKLSKKDSLGIHSYEHMMPLAKEIVKEARRAGADTLLMADSDDVWYEALSKLPVDWLKQPSALAQAILRTMTASVSMEGPEDPSLLKKISRERWEANTQGATATYRPYENRLVRTLSLELARVTEARAKTYGFDYKAWFDSTLKAMAVHPKVLREKGKRAAAILDGAKKGRLTAPDGTKMEFEFHGARPTIWTGEIRPVKGRRSTYFSDLPSGRVGMALRQGSGNGRVVSTMPIAQMGGFIRGLRWVFKDGKVSQADAKEHLDYFRMLWDSAKKSKGADQLGALFIGLNPNARYGFLTSDIVDGCVTLAIGNNEDLGGTNKNGYGFGIAFKDATLEVDSRKLVVRGKLKV